MTIPEEFLHYVWRFRLFDQFTLKSQCGRKIEILHPGQLNKDAGPDFLCAKIKFDGEVLVGDVEMHVGAKAWYDHKHDQDPAFGAVILHVVWHQYIPIYYPEGEEIPALVLQDKVDGRIIHNFEQLRQSIDAIACAGRVGEVSSFKKTQLLDSMGVGRLTLRCTYVQSLLADSGGDWERVTFILLCRAMGMRVNKEVFVRFGKAFPCQLFRKYHHDRKKIEALVFGQAGMLQGKPLDGYHDALAREYRYLSELHGIRALPHHEWKYMRMRPANFPTVRLAQLSAIYHQYSEFFGLIMSTETSSEWIDLLSAIKTGTYWDKHYRFGTESPRATTKITADFAAHLVVNVCALVLFSYGKSMDNQTYIDKAISWLQALKPEVNAISKLYRHLGFPIDSSYDSQALLYLKQEYCDKKRCLDCSLGLSLIAE